MESPSTSKFITVKEASDRLGVSEVTIRRYLDTGVLSWKRRDIRMRLVSEASVESLKYSWDNPMSHSTA